MKKNRTKDLALNTIIIGIGKISTQLVSFLLLPLYTSILTTSEYGIYDLIITIVTFLIPIITLLMDESMFRFLIDCKTDDEKKKVISQSTVYISSITAIFIIILSIINIFVKIPYLIVGLLYLLISIIAGLRNALARGLGKIKLFTLSNSIASIIHIILNVLFIVVFRWGLYGLLLSGIIAESIVSLLVFIKLILSKYVSLNDYDHKLIKDMIKYSLPLVPNSVSWAIVNLSDRLVISNVLGTSSNGIYSMSYKFPNIMDTIYNFFYLAWKESSAKAINDDDKDEFYNQIYVMLTRIMFCVSLGIIACMPIMFNWFIKKDYSSAYLYVPILVIAMYYNNMSGYYGGIFSAYKETNIMGITTAIGAVINIIVNVIFIKYIGIYAAAFSTLISCMVIFFCRKNKVRKYIKLKNNYMFFGYIILILTLFLYYKNDNTIIKIINLMIVGIYALIVNREVVFKILGQFLRKAKKC